MTWSATETAQLAAIVALGSQPEHLVEFCLSSGKSMNTVKFKLHRMREATCKANATARILQDNNALAPDHFRIAMGIARARKSLNEG